MGFSDHNSVHIRVLRFNDWGWARRQLLRAYLKKATQQTVTES